jgi:hypothetical protein
MAVHAEASSTRAHRPRGLRSSRVREPLWASAIDLVIERPSPKPTLQEAKGSNSYGKSGDALLSDISSLLVDYKA